MWRSTLAVIVLLTSQPTYAANTITSVLNTQDPTSETVLVELSQIVTGKLEHFSLPSNKVVVDIDDVASNVPRKIDLNTPNIVSVNVIRADNRVRIVFNLRKPLSYTVRTNSTRIAITFVDNVASKDIVIDNPRTPKELITIARDLIRDKGDPEDIAEALNGILLMPPGEYTQEARKLIGIAHEREGRIEKAKHDYAAYIAAYPDSDDLQYVRERLIALEIYAPKEQVNAKHERSPDKGSSATASASISEYYYAGATNGQTDQAAIISSVNVTGTFKEDEYLTKTIVRYSDVINIAPKQSNVAKLTSAYVSVNDTYRDYGIKVGRQNAIPGVLGRFDGVQATYRFSNEFGVSAQTGTPYTGSSDKRTFYGASFDYVGADTIWTGYYNYQQVMSFPERSAFGITANYLKDDNTMITTVEYDTLYNALNLITSQVQTKIGKYNLYGSSTYVVRLFCLQTVR